jgi:hypothetical protein
MVVSFVVSFAADATKQGRAEPLEVVTAAGNSASTITTTAITRCFSNYRHDGLAYIVIYSY